MKGPQFQGSWFFWPQFKDKAIEQKCQQSFAVDNQMFVRIVNATTACLSVVIIVNRLACMSHRQKHFNHLKMEICNINQEGEDHSGGHSEEHTEHCLEKIQHGFDVMQKLNLFVVLFGVALTIWQILCFIFAQIKFRPFMYSQEHPMFFKNTQIFQRCTRAVGISWMVMLLIFNTSLESVVYQSEKLGGAIDFLRHTQTRKEDKFETFLDHSLSESEFSQSFQLDISMVESLPIFFVMCATQLQSNWLLNSSFFTFLQFSSYFWKQKNMFEASFAAYTSMSVCGNLIVTGFVIFCFHRYELTSRNLMFQTLTNHSKEELTDLLEQLPDGIIIAGRQDITYMNEEALKILQCHKTVGSNQLEHVYCTDFKNPDLKMTPLEKLIFMMSQLDPRLGSLKKEHFLEVMIKSARNEAILLHLAQGAIEKLDETKQNLISQNDCDAQVKSDVFYDIRIKSHISQNQKKVLFVFTNANAEKELQRTQIMKDYTQIMYSSLSHELRTPINGIQSSLACMKQAVNPNAMQYFQICETSASFLLSLVNDTLDLAQLQAGKFKMNFEPVCVREIVSEITQLINVSLRLKEDVYLVQSVCEDVPIYFESDLQRFKQILINLMRNSTKFTNRGFVQLRVRKAQLAVKVDNQFLHFKDAVQFEIYDTGIGISKKNQESLFQLFGKVLQSNKQINKEGIGLGLYITKQLITELGGVISVKSVENKFTKFVVSLPTTCHLNPDNEDLETEKLRDFLKVHGVEIVVINEKKLLFEDLTEQPFTQEIETSIDLPVSTENFKVVVSTNNCLRQREAYKKLVLCSQPKKVELVSDFPNQFRRNSRNSSENEVPQTPPEPRSRLTQGIMQNTPRLFQDVVAFQSVSPPSSASQFGRRQSTVVQPTQNLIPGLTIPENQGISAQRDTINLSLQAYSFTENASPGLRRIEPMISRNPSTPALTPVFAQTKQLEMLVFPPLSQQTMSDFTPRNLRVVTSQDSNTQQKQTPKRSETSSSSISCDCKPVLVVDDNEINLILFKQVLKNKFNLEADSAFNGLIAVEKVQASLECCPYKCIFMDCSMPVMNGYEATRAIIKMFDEFYEERIRKQGLKVGDDFPNTTRPVIDVRRIPICALTANNTALEFKTCQEAGMSCFLSKPADPGELRAFILGVFKDEEATEEEQSTSRNAQ